MSWTEFLRTHFGRKKWCVFPRFTARLASQGYETCISQKRYKVLEETWQRQHYGAKLQSIEYAAPDLFRALKLLVDGTAPEGLYPHLAPSELLRRIERDEIEWHAMRASAFEAAERARFERLDAVADDKAAALEEAA